MDLRDTATGVTELLFAAIEKEMAAETISQTEIARRLQVNRMNLNQIFLRKRPVTIDYLLKIIDVLDLSVEIKIKRLKV